VALNIPTNKGPFRPTTNLDSFFVPAANDRPAAKGSDFS